jgi:hypothetical protein
LTICKQLVEKLGGSIHLKSEINFGSIFTFSILNDERIELKKDMSIPTISSELYSEETKEIPTFDTHTFLEKKQSVFIFIL